MPINRIASILVDEDYEAIEKCVAKLHETEKSENNKEINNTLKRKINDENSENKKLKTDGITEDEKAAIRQERREKRMRQQKFAWKLLKSKQMDSLIFCARYILQSNLFNYCFVSNIYCLGIIQRIL